MRNRSILLIVGGAAMAAGLSLATVAILQPSPSIEEAQAPVRREEILVAAQPVAKGTLLRKDDTRWQEVGANDVVTGFIVRNDETETCYAGAVVMRDFSADEPFSMADLIRPDQRDFLAAALAPDMRAITVVANAIQSAAGLMLPGDHIDIILTQRFSQKNVEMGRQVAGETVLRDLRVIAVDQRLHTPTDEPGSADGSTPPGRIPSTITLEVSEKDAERLLVAVELGKLGIALRPVVTDEPAPTEAPTTIWAADVSPALSTLGRCNVNANRKLSPPRVQVIHGDKKEKQ